MTWTFDISKGKGTDYSPPSPSLLDTLFEFDFDPSQHWPQLGIVGIIIARLMRDSNPRPPVHHRPT